MDETKLENNSVNADSINLSGPSERPSAFKTTVADLQTWSRVHISRSRKWRSGLWANVLVRALEPYQSVNTTARWAAVPAPLTKIWNRSLLEAENLIHILFTLPTGSRCGGATGTNPHRKHVVVYSVLTEIMFYKRLLFLSKDKNDWISLIVTKTVHCDKTYGVKSDFSGLVFNQWNQTWIRLKILEKHSSGGLSTSDRWAITSVYHVCIRLIYYNLFLSFLFSQLFHYVQLSRWRPLEIDKDSHSFCCHVLLPIEEVLLKELIDWSRMKTMPAPWM